MQTDIETEQQYQTRERRLRRTARRQGLHLEKSRTRTTEAVEWSTYMLIDTATRAVVAYGLPGGYGLNLDEVEEALDQVA